MTTGRWTWRSWLRLVGFLAFCAVWWLYLARYMIRPRSYWPVVVWLTVAVIAGFWHARALIRFTRMVNAVQRDEHLGIAEAGSTLFAVNQRFRYAVRAVENAFALVLGGVGLYAVGHPGLALRPWYAELTLTFFIGSIAATGYLTIRDLRVVDRVQQAAAGEDIALGPARPASWLADRLRDRLEDDGDAAS